MKMNLEENIQQAQIDIERGIRGLKVDQRPGVPITDDSLRRAIKCLKDARVMVKALNQ